MSALTEPMREQIRQLCTKYPTRQAVTLPALHMVQDEFRYVSLEAIKEIAALLELHPAEVHDTMSFYGFFRDEQHPLGKHRVWVCRSISCALRGGEELLAHLCEKYHLKPGETTEDGKVTLEFAECLGACEGAPCILINDDCEMNVTHERGEQIVNGLK
ncbi:MAG TPA: NAD(P)H-dependent oxidoreductase subunit E [Planctomycetaceae bacterium]|nr:NAD(P)H-dependent oxidoreductase subunit E [Planctomycetaceae bacterium]